MSQKEQDIQEKENKKMTSEELENQVDEQDAVDSLTKEEALKEQLEDANNKHLRLYAEFENFRKRTAKERLELLSSANEELMTALLPVLDDFDRALKAVEGTEAEEGIKLIHSKFENTLKNKGLKPMDSTLEKEFDVEEMEAITRIPAPSKKLKGKVIDEIEKGYRLGNRILRYAKVVVGE